MWPCATDGRMINCSNPTVFGRVATALVAAVVSACMARTAVAGPAGQKTPARREAVTETCDAGKFLFSGHASDRYCVPRAWLDSSSPDILGITLTYPDFIPPKDLRSDCLTGPRATCFLIRITIQRASIIARKTWPLYRCQHFDFTHPPSTDCHANFPYRSLYIGLQFPGGLFPNRGDLIQRTHRLIDGVRINQ
jgi:hypothetical protein